MNRQPILSVVIPTHNRCTLLAENLKALCSQDFSRDDYEIIVVADACEDDTQDVVDTISNQSSVPVHFLSHHAKSAAASRNFGADGALGKLLLFLDDDIIAHSNLFKSHIKLQEGSSVVLGYSKPVLPKNPTWWQCDAYRWWEDSFAEMAKPGHRFYYRDFYSGNVSMPADLFHRAGRFDNAFKGRFEDYEFGLRLLKEGAKFRFAYDAVGLHHDHTDLSLWLRRIRKEGIGDVQIGQFHPENRYPLFGGFDEPPMPYAQIRKLIRKFAFRFFQQGGLIENSSLFMASICEYLKFRGLYHKTVNFLREYNYWRGVASEIGSWPRMYAWLQEGPLPPGLAVNAPVVDIAQQKISELSEDILERANSRGLRIEFNNCEVLSISPRLGAEPIKPEHIQNEWNNAVKNQFIPALALQMIRATKGGKELFISNLSK